MGKVTLIWLTCLLLIMLLCHEANTIFFGSKNKGRGASINRQNKDCVWKVNDLPSTPNQPLYINPSQKVKNTIYDVTNFWLPQSIDEVRMKTGEKILIACPDSYVVETGLKRAEVTLTCMDSKLMEGTSRYLTQKLTCKSQRVKPQVKVINTVDREDSPLCRKYTRAKIGFELTDGKFYETMEVRFNSHTKETVYTKHLLTPEIRGIQTGRAGVNFLVSNIQPLYIDAKTVDDMYKTQRKSLQNQLGTSKNDILSKGHFAANGDFVYRTLQTATFMYENTAPQWQQVNGNNWNALEDSCRQFVKKINRNIEVYTGVSGTLQLEDVRNKQLKDVYLEQIPPPKDPRDNFKFKISNFFWKVLYDRRNKQGIAFAIVNNPFEAERSVTGIDKLCTDICNTGALRPAWKLTWKYNKYEYGYAICCAVGDMAKMVPEIPQIDVSNGILNQ